MVTAPGGILRRSRSSALDREMAARVYAFPQILAGFEVRNIFAGQCDGFTRLGIAADPRRPEVQRKAAETPNLNTLALGERVAHKVQEMLDCKFDILRRKVFLLARDCFNEFGFCHLFTLRL